MVGPSSVGAREGSLGGCDWGHGKRDVFLDWGLMVKCAWKTSVCALCVREKDPAEHSFFSRTKTPSTGAVILTELLHSLNSIDSNNLPLSTCPISLGLYYACLTNLKSVHPTRSSLITFKEQNWFLLTVKSEPEAFTGQVVPHYAERESTGSHENMDPEKESVVICVVFIDTRALNWACCVYPVEKAGRVVDEL